MNWEPSGHGPDHVESVSLYALRALPAEDAAAAEALIAACPECREELQALRPVVDTFTSWPAAVLRPSSSLWDRLSRRITAETGAQPIPEPAPEPEPRWEEALPGIAYRVLGMDEASGRVTLLLSLAPGAEYPPHVHAGVEELYLLEGDLFVNDRTLHAGDYLRSAPGTSDHKVWSENGCTGVLITSAGDLFR